MLFPPRNGRFEGVPDSDHERAAVFQGGYTTCTDAWDVVALVWLPMTGVLPVGRDDKVLVGERLGLAGFDNPETLWLQGLQCLPWIYRTLYDSPGIGGMISGFINVLIPITSHDSEVESGELCVSPCEVERYDVEDPSILLPLAEGLHVLGAED